MNDDDVIETVVRKEARSGRVSYSEPLVLHESRIRRIVLVPIYVPRRDGTDLAIKIVTYQKQPTLGWVIHEDKSISLKESAARKLLKGLKEYLAVAEGDSDGSYILVKVNEGTAQIGTHDPAAVASALARVLGSEDIIQHLADTELSEELVNAFRGAIRLSEMRSAVVQLRHCLDTGDNCESTYQNWCQTHTWAFGNAYVMRDEVREISPGDHLDLLLPTVISGYRDIVELKRPDVDVLNYDKQHKNYYFSADVSRAIGQCHRYLDVLHEVAAKGLRDHPEIIAYHPRAIIVIGRSTGWDLDRLKALHGLNRRLSGVALMTYDQLLAQGERLIEMLSSETNPEENKGFQEPWDDDDASL